ncbi:MAG TPA: FAD-dependent oxidoreductase [Termitinemataceae bacterium]|nr:FAD-dependent oxidoreductase [Termitinemataceae bacterium]HOM22890.1 FAD-dependent oxidoreductase [Termitinemataceae bacterium]
MVIGAGFAGLTTAALLAKEGQRVTILEKCEFPGGRARLWEKMALPLIWAPPGILCQRCLTNILLSLGRNGPSITIW